MKSVIIPGSESMERILPFYLAAEEWVASHLPAGDWFFAWQVTPTVICGRHQEMPLEVDLDYAASHDIRVWRRRSGGGCVYADRHNVMFSYITDTSGVQGSFTRYTDHICRMLATLGIEAEPTGRNDVAIGGHKVAGNAWYRSSGRSIVHGTMLYDADFATMGRVLTPSRAKLASKGVQSVPARVTTLRSAGLDMTCADFVRHATATLCPDGAYTLTPADMAEVEKIMQGYLDPGFLQRDLPARPPCSLSMRIDGIGEIRARWHLTAGGITDGVALSGDFFAPDSRVRRAERQLTGIAPDRVGATLHEIFTE